MLDCNDDNSIVCYKTPSVLLQLLIMLKLVRLCRDTCTDMKPRTEKRKYSFAISP